MISGRSKLAIILALAYTLILVYASLQPFSGWRVPAEEVFRYLGAPWPRYVTAFDLALNVVAYLPFGVILFAALRSLVKATPAFLGAATTAGLLSLALESTQMFLPARIASNLDVLTNTSGAAMGALIAWLFTLPAFANNPLAVVRRIFIRSGALGDCGLLVVAIWILIQFHQAPLALGTGDVREFLRPAPLFVHTPQSYLLVETAIVALISIAMGLLVSLLLKPRRWCWPAIAFTLVLAAVAKSIAVIALSRSTNWAQWLTPGVAMGAGTGIMILAAALKLPHTSRCLAAIFCIAAVVGVVNSAPENPYQLVPAFMLNPQTTHLVNLVQILRTLSQIWPLIATLLLFYLWRDLHRANVRPAQ
jgi:VanZ family protein